MSKKVEIPKFYEELFSNESAFESVDDEQELEKLADRISFLVSKEKLKDLTLSMKGKKTKGYKSLFLNKEISEDIKDEILSTEKEVEFDEKKFISILLGNEQDVFKTAEDYIQLFEICEILKLHQHKYVLLKRIQGIEDLEFLLKLFFKSFRKFEKKEKVTVDDLFKKKDEEKDAPKTRFSSVLNVILFNLFKEKFYEKIDSDEAYEKILESLNVLSDLKRYKVSPIEDYFQFKEDDLPKSLLEIYNEQKKFLYEKRNENFNFLVGTVDGNEVKVHQEILIKESDYFYQSLKNVEKLDIPLTERELEVFLEYIYCGTINFGEKELPQAFNLLSVISKFKDIAFIVKLMGKIKEVASVVSLEEFLEEYSKFCYMFHQDSKYLEKSAKGFFLFLWKENCKPKKLVKRIESGYFKHIITGENTTLKKRNNLVEKENEKLRGVVKVLGGEIKNLKKIIKDLRKRYEDLKKK